MDVLLKAVLHGEVGSLAGRVWVSAGRGTGTEPQEAARELSAPVWGIRVPVFPAAFACLTLAGYNMNLALQGTCCAGSAPATKDRSLPSGDHHIHVLGGQEATLPLSLPAP